MRRPYVLFVVVSFILFFGIVNTHAVNRKTTKALGEWVKKAPGEVRKSRLKVVSDYHNGLAKKNNNTPKLAKIRATQARLATKELVKLATKVVMGKNKKAKNKTIKKQVNSMIRELKVSMAGPETSDSISYDVELVLSLSVVSVRAVQKRIEKLFVKTPKGLEDYITENLGEPSMLDDELKQLRALIPWNLADSVSKSSALNSKSKTEKLRKYDKAAKKARKFLSEAIITIQEISDKDGGIITAKRVNKFMKDLDGARLESLDKKLTALLVDLIALRIDDHLVYPVNDY